MSTRIISSLINKVTNYGTKGNIFRGCAISGIALGALLLFESCTKESGWDYYEPRQEENKTDLDNKKKVFKQDLTFDTKLTAIKNFFREKLGITNDSDVICVYKNDNSRTYYTQNIEGKTLYCDPSDSGYLGVTYSYPSLTGSSVKIISHYSSDKTLNTESGIEVRNDTLYHYKDNKIAGKLYKKDNNFEYDDGNIKQNISIQKCTSFPSAITFNATATDAEEQTNENNV